MLASPLFIQEINQQCKIYLLIIIVGSYRLL